MLRVLQSVLIARCRILFHSLVYNFPFGDALSSYHQQPPLFFFNFYFPHSQQNLKLRVCAFIELAACMCRRHWEYHKKIFSTPTNTNMLALGKWKFSHTQQKAMTAKLWQHSTWQRKRKCFSHLWRHYEIRRWWWWFFDTKKIKKFILKGRKSFHLFSRRKLVSYSGNTMKITKKKSNKVWWVFMLLAEKNRWGFIFHKWRH